MSWHRNQIQQSSQSQVQASTQERNLNILENITYNWFLKTVCKSSCEKSYHKNKMKNPLQQESNCRKMFPIKKKVYLPRPLLEIPNLWKVISGQFWIRYPLLHYTFMHNTHSNPFCITYFRIYPHRGWELGRTIKGTPIQNTYIWQFFFRWNWCISF
jgi:hypothetical protein